MRDDRKNQNWVDYIEGELDPSTEEDLRKLLSGSHDDAREVESLANLKSSLKKSDPALQNPVVFNETLYASIMNEVEGTKVQPRWRLEILKPQFVASIAATLAAVLVGLSFTQQFQSQEQIAKHAAESDWLMQASLHDPKALADTVNDYQSDKDFVLEALAHQMEGLSDDEVSERFEELIGQ